jgi:hypothetical protein
VPGEGDQPSFQPVTVGIEQQDFTELTSGVTDGQKIITTGAAALRAGDRIVLAGQRAGGAASGGRSGRGLRRGGGAGVNANQGQQSVPQGR